MAQTSSHVRASQTQPITIPTPSKKTSGSGALPQLPLFSLLEPGSPALSDCESALDEDDTAYDMYHLPAHHRRNALSFEEGFEFPMFLRRRMSAPHLNKRRSAGSGNMVR
ncbi:uncharacterized protein F4807DRAFT_457670 [Annulohypoxylon truncatum]|uniref:uncharacterized protein n=1 Tax=Annulohypoxylon truncatum TaxID=327061 RepID=UPI0020072A89|nr:uncharacterized protein F4807DRAFT_457670 [Annulohypoxylon truncatum]KAI1212169.1 hypothetical protein F4807DRAFT_457670 [Annulohypoxylon truncatum]